MLKTLLGGWISKAPPPKPGLSLKPTEVTEFMDLLDRIENEHLWNTSLHMEVGDYMLRTGISYAQLMERYEEVCPDFRKKDFPLKDGLRIVGEFMDRRRISLYAAIYRKVSLGEPVDPKQMIRDLYLDYMRASLIG